MDKVIPSVLLTTFLGFSLSSGRISVKMTETSDIMKNTADEKNEMSAFGKRGPIQAENNQTQFASYEPVSLSSSNMYWGYVFDDGIVPGKYQVHIL